MITTTKKEKEKRKTLVEQAGEVQVRDPAAHARKAVSELDKTAKNSLLKRKACKTQLEEDSKELHHVEEQIARIRLRYDPLCSQLEEQKQQKINLLKMLDSCLNEEKRIMSTTKAVVSKRVMDDAKLSRKMISSELAEMRGYSLDPSSTFSQRK